ncbi:MAG: AAA family ATPase [Candidatus Micrarchaeota archaeon]
MKETVPRRFIGLTGTFASGKGAVIEAAEKILGKKAAVLSTSDFVREETTRRGLSLERTNLQKVSTAMRQERGFGVFAEIALKRADALSSSVKVVLVDGIRNPGEVEMLRNAVGKNFRLWAVDAPISLRYQRVKSRARAGEHLLSFAEFKASEEKERKGAGAAGQLIDACMALADENIENDGSLEELEKKVAALLRR